MRLSLLVVLLLAGAAVLFWALPPAPLPPENTAPAKAVAGRFAVQDGGKTVLDRLTGLHWQQGFSGSTMDWAAAKLWCSNNTAALPGSGWRLPTVRELDTIVDRQTQQPAIDPVLSANTPSEYFWTSTPWVGGGSAWSVYFNFGYSFFHDTSSSFRARCVR